MSALNDIKKFEKHHAAILIFLLIAGVFLINIFAFTAAYDSVRESQVAGVAPLVVVQEDSLPSVAAETTDASDQPPEKVAFLAGLRGQIETIMNAEGVDMAIYIRDLETDEVLEINGNTTYVSASFYKLFAAYEVARQIDLGILEPSAQTGFDAGTTSIEDCLYRTLSYSDNPCGRALRKLVGADSAPLPAINEAGFLGTSLVNDYPTTSASDVALFFERMYDGTIFAPQVIDLLLEPLKAQEIDNRLPQGVPDEVEIAHKTADLEGYSHDGGIFYTQGGDYILVVLSGPWANGYTDSPSAHIAISSLVYQWFNPKVDGSSF